MKEKTKDNDKDNEKNKKLSNLELKKTIFSPQETSPKVENYKEIIEAWLEDKHIHSKTRLTLNQIIALTTLKSIAEKYSVKCIQTLIDNFVRYKLSEGGQSSKELVDILKNKDEGEENDNLMKQIEPFLK